MDKKKPVFPLMKNGMITPTDFLERIKNCDWSNFIVRTENAEYLNVASAFDTENTTFFYNDKKVIDANTYSKLIKKDREKYKPGATTYIWMFGLCGLVTYGRTTEEFVDFSEKLTEYFRKVNGGLYITIPVYVHNLAYDFAFIHKYFNFEKVFSLEKRKPLTARTERGIEFRCSYLMTGVGLAKLAEKCTKYHNVKMIGDLNYDLLRHSKTNLTEKELKYCENDVRVIMNYITEQIEKEGKINKIPLTKTGYVRRECRERCLKSKKYANTISKLTLQPEEYEMLKQAFSGGFTHANPWHREEECENVTSMDFTSSYPAVMVSEYFPVSRGQKVYLPLMNEEDFEEYIKTKCCLMTVEFGQLQSRFEYEHYISKSRTDEKALKDAIVDNGRIVEAKNVCMTITEKDLEIIKKCYKVSGMRIMNMYIYKRGYLPTELIKCVLDFYKGKTTLKGIEEKLEEYQLLKEFVNAVYGMMVTDIVRDDIVYTDDWQENVSPVLEDKIEAYNKNKKRFTFYPWGVWITAHARYNLWTGIFELGPDYIYSDTDSVKYLNSEKHALYFKQYNEMIKRKMETAMKYHGLSTDEWRPKTIKGVEKPLGYWDFDGFYNKFKTLGAKKYMVEENGNIHITVAGVNKRTGADFFGRMENPFEEFKTGTVIGPDDCGKLLHQYIKGETNVILEDYTGEKYRVHQKDGVALSPIGYEIGDGKLKDLWEQIKGAY